MPTVDVGIGALGYVGYALETTEGTAVAPTHFLPVTSISFNDSNDYNSPLTIRGGRDINLALPAPYQVEGSMELPMVIEDIGLLLKSAFAASVNTSAYTGGGYTHTFTPGNTSPTFTFETSRQGILMMRHTGVRVNTFELKGSFGEPVAATFGLDGIDRVKYTGAAATPSYATSSTSPLNFSRAKVQIGGSDSAFVKDFTFNVNNNVSHIGTLRTTRSYYRVALGAREIGLGMTLDFQDATEYDRLLNDTEFAVQLYMEGPTGIGAGGTSYMSLKIDLPRVKYKTVGVPLNAGDFLSQDVECTVLQPIGGNIATVTLNNSKASTAELA